MSEKRKGYGRPYPNADCSWEYRANLKWCDEHPPTHKQKVVRKRNHQIRTLNLIKWHVANIGILSIQEQSSINLELDKALDRLKKLNKEKYYYG